MFYNQKWASPKDLSINIAFSCGIDSVFAAYFIKKKLNKEVILYHFNHKLRPQNDEMESATKEFADFLGVKYYIGYRKKEIPNAGSLEAFCRDIRYNWLQQNCEHITVCHHLDDAVENYIQNTLKGVPEYMPISPISGYGRLKIYRPFLTVKKNDIEKFAGINNLNKYVYTDTTNTDQKYMRNWIRHTVIPTISQNYHGLHKVVKKKFYL
jgi:tRNA(Ile)-lysidine synthase